MGSERLRHEPNHTVSSLGRQQLLQPPEDLACCLYTRERQLADIGRNILVIICLKTVIHQPLERPSNLMLYRTRPMLIVSIQQTMVPPRGIRRIPLIRVGMLPGCTIGCIGSVTKRLL